MGQMVVNGEVFAGKNLDLANNIVTFDSQDNQDPTEYTEMPLLSSNNPLKTLMRTISIFGKNLRYLVKMIGTTDISQIGDGTVTGAISELNTGIDLIFRTYIGDSVLCKRLASFGNYSDVYTPLPNLVIPEIDNYEIVSVFSSVTNSFVFATISYSENVRTLVGTAYSAANSNQNAAIVARVIYKKIQQL